MLIVKNDFEDFSRNPNLLLALLLSSKHYVSQ